MAMRELNARERRLIRVAGVGLAAYLAVFAVFRGWRAAERQRAEYFRLLGEVRLWEDRLALAQDKAEVARRLMEEFRLDPASLSRTSLVARASAAIQQAALRGGVMLGPIRETRGGAGDITTIQIEAQAPPPALLQFLGGLGSLGHPILTESLQLTAPPNGMGPVKANLTIQVLDFEAWKPSETKPDA